MGQAWKVGLAVVVVALVAFGGGLALFGGGDQTAPGPAAATDRSHAPTPAATPDEAALAQVAAERGCAARAIRDDSYDVSVTSEPDPPRAEGTTFRLAVTRDGRPVTDAQVCLSADMTDMAHDAVGGEAQEIEPGTYEVRLSFTMRGPWAGAVKIIEPGRPAVRAPFSASVQ